MASPEDLSATCHPLSLLSWGSTLPLSPIELDLLAYSPVWGLREVPGVASRNHWLAPSQMVTQRKKVFWWVGPTSCVEFIQDGMILGSAPRSRQPQGPSSGRHLHAVGCPAWEMPEGRNWKIFVRLLGAFTLVGKPPPYGSLWVLALEEQRACHVFVTNCKII